MQNNQKSDASVRINTLQNDVHSLETNMSVYMQYTKEEILKCNQTMQQILQDQQIHNQKIQLQNTNLDQNISQIFDKYKLKLDQQFKQMEEIQKLRSLEEGEKRMEIQNKLIKYDQLLEQLDKKWEQKSNDRYIASIIQNSLLNNQSLCQFIVDKAISATDDKMKNLLQIHQHQIDDRITQQYFLIQNFQTYIRKQERVIEEMQQAMSVTRESIIDFQKQQNKKMHQFSVMTTNFKDFVNQQLNKQLNQLEEIKNFSEDQNQRNLQINQLLADFQIQIKSNVDLQKQEFQELSEKMQKLIKKLQEEQLQDMQQKNQQFKHELILQKENCDKKQSELENQIKHLSHRLDVFEKEKIKQGVPLQQRALVKQKQIVANNSKQIPLKDQLAQIENLFNNVQLIFQYINRNVKQQLQQDNLNYSSDHSPRFTNEILIRDNTEYKSQPQVIQQIKMIQEESEEQFNDTKMYNDVNRPLQIVGRQQFLDIRPSIEIQALQQKIRQVVSMLGDDPLKQSQIDNSFSGRPNSAKKRLPKINSKSMHFSLDD